jgi:hypothetical protein
MREKNDYENSEKSVNFFGMINIKKIVKNERQFLSLTTLYWSEFELLLPHFEARWKGYFKYKTLRGKRRKKPLTATQLARSTTKFNGIEEKLFFILYFFKNGHIQQSLAAQFEMDQGQISRYIKILEPLLLKSIIDLHLQPAQSMEELIRLFRYRQQKQQEEQDRPKSESLHLDATERPIERAVDYLKQKEEYSGKAGGHRLKNSVVCDEYQYIYFAGRTFCGSTHDKTMADEELDDLTPLERFQLWWSKDKGYQGYRPKGVHLLEPFKAARNRPLTEFQKEYNKWVGSIRICCEHAIGGVKRCRLLKDTLRYTDEWFRHRIFLIGCGLHNLRSLNRPSYARAAQRTRERINLNFSQT